MLGRRLSYLDQAKGFAILLMVFAHTMPGETICTWIFAFHMPLFFIVSGVLLAWKLGEERESLPRMREAMKRRFSQLVVPYCVFSLALVAFYGTLQYLSGDTIQVKMNLFRIVTMQGIDSLWFLPCYFVAEMTMRVTLCKPLLAHIMGGGMIVLLCIYFSLTNENINGWLWRLALKFLISYVFVYIGYELTRMHILEKMHIVLSVFVLIVCSVLALYNGFSAIGSLQLNNPFLFFINAVGLTMAWFFLFHKEDDAKWSHWLSFFGKNSIVILCTNNLLIEIIRLLDSHLTHGILLTYRIWGSIALTIIIIGIEIPFILGVMHSRLVLLFGKSK